MTSERLQEFFVLASLLNYSRAAENLFISQSLLSRHMKGLEEELGVKLFVRNTHKVSLTEEGRFLFRETQRLLKKADLMSSLSLAASVGTTGSISIRCHEQTLCASILLFLQGFRRQYPEISMFFEVIPSAPDIGIIEDADFLLSPCYFMDQLSEQMQADHLLSQEAYIAYPPRHPFGDLYTVSLEQLGGETLLVPFAGESFGPYARNALLASRRCPGYLRRISVPTVADALLMVELGEGIMLLPQHLISRVYPHTRTLPVTDTDCLFPVYLYSKNNPDNSAAALFLSSIRQNYQIQL